MFEKILEIDKCLLLYINGLHNEFLDNFFWLFTQTSTWIPAVILLLAVIVRTKKWESIGIILAIGLTILLADQVSSEIIKPLVERFRPTHNPSIKNLIHVVNEYRGGSYGFVSSHAANSFGIALFLTLLFRSHFLGWTMFLWAIINSYSRMYLGVHYPLDILGGILVGLLAAIVSYKLLRNFRPQSLYVSKKSTQIDRYGGFSPNSGVVAVAGIYITTIVFVIISVY